MHFALDEQIASQPQAIRTLLTRMEADTVPVLDLTRPIVFGGLGTSLHACRIAAEWVIQLTSGTIRPLAVNAHDLALRTLITAKDQVIIVSHRGTKQFPNATIEHAWKIGATIVLITSEDAPKPPHVHAIVRTCPDERSGAHTVSYLTALVALGYLVARLLGPDGKPLLPALTSVPDALTQTLALPAPTAAAQRLLQLEPLLVTGFGLDTVTADEAALKLKEGAYKWAEGMQVENALHGPPAALRTGMGVISITPTIDDGGRTEILRTLLRDLSIASLTCGKDDEDLLFAPVDPLVRPLVAIVPLQRLTAELARLVGSNPDQIHRDVEPWKTAMGRVVL